MEYLIMSKACRQRTTIYAIPTVVSKNRSPIQKPFCSKRRKSSTAMRQWVSGRISGFISTVWQIQLSSWLPLLADSLWHESLGVWRPKSWPKNVSQPLCKQTVDSRNVDSRNIQKASHQCLGSNWLCTAMHGSIDPQGELRGIESNGRQQKQGGPP